MPRPPQWRAVFPPGAPLLPLTQRAANLITVTRIVPNKQIERLLAIDAFPARSRADARLTIVGGVEQRHIGYWEDLVARIERDQLDCIDFVGPSTDIRPCSMRTGFS